MTSRLEIAASSKQEQPRFAIPRSHLGCYADFRCCLVGGFFATASFASFLPAIAMEHFLLTAATLRASWLAGALCRLCAAISWQRVHQVDDISPRGRSFA